MKEIHQLTNLVPIIAKGDSLTTREKEEQKTAVRNPKNNILVLSSNLPLFQIRESLKEKGIKVLDFPDSQSPFTVIGNENIEKEKKGYVLFAHDSSPNPTLCQMQPFVKCNLLQPVYAIHVVTEDIYLEIK